MRIFATPLAVVALGLFASTVQAQTAVYDFSTGVVTFDGLEGQAGITLISDGVSFLTDDFNGFGQINDTALANAAPQAKLAWSNFGGFQGGPFESGPVIPLGTDPELISVQLSSIGAPPVTLERRPHENPDGATDGFWAINVPEPSTYALAGLALIGIGIVRRRRG